MRARQGLKQFMLFAGLGVVGTACHYLTLIALVEWLQVAPVAASTAGFVAGASVNYFLNYHITFASAKRHLEAMSKFFATAALGAAINLLVMYTGTAVLLWHYLLAQGSATALVLLWNFLLNKFWTFAPPARRTL